MVTKEIAREYIAYDYIYKGKCPICGKEQSNEICNYVDVVCTKCILDKVKDHVINNTTNDDNALIGSIILDYKYNPHGRFDTEITILTPDLKVKRIFIYGEVQEIDMKNVGGLSLFKGYRVTHEQTNIEPKIETVVKHASLLDRLYDYYDKTFS